MYTSYISELNNNGYSIVPQLYSKEEIYNIAQCIANHPSSTNTEHHHVFAIRQFLKTIPELKPLLFTNKAKLLLNSYFKTNHHLSKAIYFNKPPQSNWFVSYHQDLSISVKEKVEIDQYTHWTKKHGQLGVIPPTPILDNVITLRIHLDKTTKDNGALKVIPQSHLHGVLRPETLTNKKEKEVISEASPGDVMLMKPLTLHASDKTTNNTFRRIIHLEFSSLDLEHPLEWLEKEDIF